MATPSDPGPGPPAAPLPGDGAVVVIPTYNERENLAPLVRRVREELPGARILVVDDASPDGTGAIADALARDDPSHLEVLHRQAKEGLGAAYVAAFRHLLRQRPGVRWVVQMDADFSHDPAYLVPLLEAARHADVVVGSRYVDGISIVHWPLHRLVVSRLGTAYARLVTGLPITDCTSGYKCFRIEVLRALDLERFRSNGYAFPVEASFRAWRRGFGLEDLPIIFQERRHGHSKLHLRIAWEALYVVALLGLERLFRRGRTPGRADGGGAPRGQGGRDHAAR